MSEAKEEQVEAPVPGSPEYDAAMAAKFRETKETAGDPYEKEMKEEPKEVPQRPDNIPEKFWDSEKGEVKVDAVLESYSSLEAEMSKRQEAAKQSDDKDGEDGKEEKAVRTAVEEAGLDFDSLGSKIIEKGTLDDKDYEAFEKIGFGKDFVDEVVDSLKYRRDTEQAKAVEYIGGEEKAVDLMQWAAQNLSEGEIVKYNEMLAGPDWKVAVDTISSLRGGSKRTAGEPRTVTPNSSSRSGTVGYESRDEMRADMSDPLYRDPGPKGEAFRREVYQKVAVSAWNRA